MSPRKQAPPLSGLLLFLGVNYAVGYLIGQLITGSTIASIFFALVTPSLSLLAMALVGARRANPETLDKA